MFCSGSSSGSCRPASFWRTRLGSLLTISGVQWTLTPGGKMRLVSEAHSQDNITSLCLNWFSQLALASSSLTSYPFLFRPSCFGHMELGAVSLTLPAVSCFCSCCSLCLERSPLSAIWEVLFFRVLSHSTISSVVSPNCSRQTQAFRLSLLRSEASSPVLYCTVTVSFPKRLWVPWRQGPGFSNLQPLLQHGTHFTPSVRSCGKNERPVHVPLTCPNIFLYGNISHLWVIPEWGDSVF